MSAIYRKITVLLLGVCAVSIGLTALFGGPFSKEKANRLSVVAGIYPMYTAALQVVGDCEDVSVTCLTGTASGCLHDYQLSPSERAVLASADVLVLNGGGAESFLADATADLAAVVVDTSSGTSAPKHHEEHGDHHHEGNEHTWVDPSRYAAQVQKLCDGLCEADPTNAAVYRANTAKYLGEINAVKQQLDELSLPFTHAMLFHSSMAYVAEGLHLETVGTVNVGEDEAASAADLVAFAKALRGKNVLFLYDSQYETMYEDLTAYADTAASVKWNIGAKKQNGVADCDAWLFAMRANVAALKEATV